MRYNIYIGHSRDSRLNYQKDLYLPLLNALCEHHIIVPHENGAESVINSETLIPSLDFMVAEVSYPATGLGLELAWARAANVPVLCIHQTNCRPSSSITRLFENISAYENVSDMANIVQEWVLAK